LPIEEAVHCDSEDVNKVFEAQKFKHLFKEENIFDKEQRNLNCYQKIKIYP